MAEAHLATDSGALPTALVGYRPPTAGNCRHPGARPLCRSDPRSAHFTTVDGACSPLRSRCWSPVRPLPTRTGGSTPGRTRTSRNTRSTSDRSVPAEPPRDAILDRRPAVHAGAAVSDLLPRSGDQHDIAGSARLSATHLDVARNTDDTVGGVPVRGDVLPALQCAIVFDRRSTASSDSGERQSRIPSCHV